MHTFLPGRRVAFLGRPSQRLSLPTYWFIRGDLEPLCHMLPQMGTSPQAIQALWQQAWTIMDAKGKRQKELCQPPRQHTFSVRASICTCMDYKSFAFAQDAWCDAVFAFVWFHALTVYIRQVIQKLCKHRSTSIFNTCNGAVRVVNTFILSACSPTHLK